MKRTAETSVQVPEAEFEGKAIKKTKVGDDHPEGSWICTHCGNTNWPKRTKCNKAGCNMPKEMIVSATHPEGSWACTTCENINWPKRTVCNKPQCSTPRAGVAQPAGMLRPPPLFRPPYGAGMPQQQQQQQHPDGSWVCIKCANVNWPARTVCNNTRCKEPKAAGASSPAAAAGGADMQSYYAMMGGAAPLAPGAPHAPSTAGMYGMGGPAGLYDHTGYAQTNYPPMPATGMSMPYGAQPSPYANQSSATAGHPPGSWACSACQNVNWPKRSTCNKSGCGAARPGGPPAAPVPAGQQQHPEGSWECPSCTNINWPERSVCNKKSCMTARPV